LLSLKGILRLQIIVMDPIISVISAWLGEGATVVIAGKSLEGIKQRLSANEWGRSLQQAIQDAQAKNEQLFFACEPSEWNGISKFLQAFFQSGEVLRELQKPLQELGKPSVEISCAAFEQQAHPNPKDYKTDWLKTWMMVSLTR
jgi:hypothetical protein